MRILYDIVDLNKQVDAEVYIMLVTIRVRELRLAMDIGKRDKDYEIRLCPCGNTNHTAFLEKIEK